MVVVRSTLELSFLHNFPRKAWKCVAVSSIQALEKLENRPVFGLGRKHASHLFGPRDPIELVEIRFELCGV